MSYLIRGQGELSQNNKELRQNFSAAGFAVNWDAEKLLLALLTRTEISL
jgi:hypothetical protein